MLDTGIDLGHPEFDKGRREVRNIASYVDGEEFEWWPEVGWTTKPEMDEYLDANDNHGHGTMTSSMAAGRTLGTAPDANLYHIKVLSDTGWGEDEWSIVALDKIAELVTKCHIEGHRTVVSISFGDVCAEGDVEYCRYTNPQARAVESLVEDLNVQVVIAAGNDDDDGCFYTPQSSAYAVSVGASDVDDYVASWSDVGACVDVIAPGVDMPLALSRLAREFYNNNTEFWRDSPHEEIAVASGTSFAAPLVAGTLTVFSELLNVSTVDAAALLLDDIARVPVPKSSFFGSFAGLYFVGSSVSCVL